MAEKETTNVVLTDAMQAASFNAFGRVPLENGQTVNVQVTFRHGMTAAKMTADFKEFVAFLNDPALVAVEFDKPLAQAPEQPRIQVTDATGLPVVDQDHNPVTVPLPDGVRLYTVAALFHDKNKDGTKDILKVVSAEAPYNTKYGVSCFHGGPDGWKAWPVGKDNRYAPPEGFKHVLIRDPQDGGRYADVIEFRP